jgi:hypothetical protein
MTLFIDTTNFETTTFVLKNQKVLKQKLKILPYESFNVTKKLEEFLKKNMAIKTIPFVDIMIDQGEKNRQKIDELLREK